MTRAETDQYYETLELASGASLEEAKRAYRDLVKVWHPDRFTHGSRLQEKAQEKLKKINEAYTHLCSIITNQTTKVRAKPAEPQTVRPRESWITDLKDGQVVRIVDLNSEDSYFG